MLSSDVDMNYTTTTNVSYTFSHVKLLSGWLLVCGRTIYSTAKLLLPYETNIVQIR